MDPRTWPADVGATTVSVSAAASLVHAPAWIAANANAVCLTNVLRLVVVAMNILRLV